MNGLNRDRSGTVPVMTIALDRAVVLGLVLASVACAVAGVRNLLVGVPVGDPWLFPALVLSPCLASIALAVSLCFSPETRARVALFVLSVGGSLYLMETVLLAVPERRTPALRQLLAQQGVKVDNRRLTEVISDLRAGGKEAHPVLGAAGLRLLQSRIAGGFALGGHRIVPLALISNALVVHCNESGQYTTFRTDERGFNNPAGSWSLPIDVALVGDSNIQGACVHADQNLVAHVRRQRSGVIGLGLDGAGPLSMLGMIKEYLPAVRPAEVYWFYFEGNDLTNLAEEIASPELRMYLEPGWSQRLLAHQSEIERMLLDIEQKRMPRVPEPHLATVEPRSAATIGLQWLTLYRVRATLALADVEKRLESCCDVELLEFVLREANREIESWQGTLHFVYLPAAGRYHRPMSTLLDANLRQRTRVLRTVHRLGIPVIDVSQAFAASADPRNLFAGERGHYNAEGYRVAAMEVLSQMRRP